MENSLPELSTSAGMEDILVPPAIAFSLDHHSFSLSLPAQKALWEHVVPILVGIVIMYNLLMVPSGGAHT